MIFLYKYVIILNMETQVNQLAVIFAYVASVEDSGRKVFSEYLPLVEYCIVEKMSSMHSFSIDSLQTSMNEMYGINIPKATLIKLLRCMEKSKKITMNNAEVIVHDDELDLCYIETRQKVESQLDDLYSKCVNYFKTYNIEITKFEAKELLLNVAKNNSALFSEVYGYDKKVENLEIKNADKVEGFFNEVLLNDHQLKEIFASLLIGAQKTALLNLKPNQLEEVDNSGIGIRTVYFDSNFMFRVLGLQDKLSNEVAKETFAAMKKLGCDFFVNTITIDEMIKAIDKHLVDTDTISPGTKAVLKKTNLRMSGFLAAESIGVTRADFRQLTSRKELIKRIESEGIKIDFNETIKYRKELVDSIIIEKNRSSYSYENALHDIKLISLCEQKRKVSGTDNDKVCFLTNDIRLTAWNAKRDRQDNVCFTEMQLSSLLWMKGINKDLVFNNVIIALADTHSWDYPQVIAFQKSFARYVSQKNISSEKINVFVTAAIREISEKGDIYDNEDFSALFVGIDEKIEEIDAEKQNLAELNVEITEIRKINEDLIAAQSNKLLQQEEALQQCNRALEASNNNVSRFKIQLNKLKHINKVQNIILIIATSFFVGGIVAGILLLCKYNADYSIIGFAISAIPLVVSILWNLVCVLFYGDKFAFHNLLFIYIIKKTRKVFSDGTQISTKRELKQHIKEFKEKIESEENIIKENELMKEKLVYGIQLLKDQSKT